MKLRFVLMLITACSCFVSCAIAGEQTSFPFYTYSISANLGKPYGRTTVTIQCTMPASKNPKERKLLDVTVATEKGVFRAPETLLSPLSGLVNVQILSWADKDIRDFDIQFLAFHEKESGEQEFAINFADGVFSLRKF
jgi:hypothetical protein